MNLTQRGALMDLLDIQFDEVTATRVSGSVAADERHHQPWGIVHGGLYTAVIESFATTGAFEAVNDRGQQAVGVSNATDFLRPHRTGRLRVVAVPIQQGRTVAGRDPPPRGRQGDRPRSGAPADIDAER